MWFDFMCEARARVGYASIPFAVRVVEGGYVTGLGEKEARWRLNTTTIEGLGRITNRCVRGADHAKADFLPPQLAKILGKDRAI